MRDPLLPCEVVRRREPERQRGGQVALRKEGQSSDRGSPGPRAGAPPGIKEKLAARGKSSCLSASGPLARQEFCLGISKKRRNYETAKNRGRFDGNDVFARRQVVSTAGEDRLRSQRKLRAIQDLLVGTS